MSKDGINLILGITAAVSTAALCCINARAIGKFVAELNRVEKRHRKPVIVTSKKYRSGWDVLFDTPEVTTTIIR